MDRDNSSPLPRLILAAGLLTLIMWAELPEWQRALILNRVRFRLRLAMAFLARRSGHAAMGDELAGRDEAARAGYSWTARLSQLRDRL